MFSDALFHFNDAVSKFGDKITEGLYSSFLKQIENETSFLTHLEKYLSKFYINKTSQRKKADIETSVLSILTNIVYKSTDYIFTLSVFEFIKSKGIEPNLYHYNILVQQFASKESIDYLQSNVEIQTIDARIITKIINHLNVAEALYFYKILTANKYLINDFIYNALIKKVDLTNSYDLINEMQQNGFSPDIYTLNPLLRKWKDTNELLDIVKIASKNKINPDTKALNTIVYHIKFLELESVIVSYIYENQVNIKQSINKIWYNKLMEINNMIINEKMKYAQHHT